MGSVHKAITPVLMGLALFSIYCVTPSAASSEWDRFNKLGTSAYKDGALADAEDYFKSALQDAERNPQEGHLATSLTNLGAVYRDEQEFDQAESCFKRSLQIKEDSLGRLDPSVASTLQHYAALLRQMRRVPEARQLEGRADGIMTISRNQLADRSRSDSRLAAVPPREARDNSNVTSAGAGRDMPSTDQPPELSEKQLKEARSLYDEAERARKDGRLFDAQSTEARARRLFGSAFTNVWRTTASRSALDEQAAEDQRIAAEDAERARLQEQQIRDEEQLAMENQPLVPVSYTDYGTGGVMPGSPSGTGQHPGFHGHSCGHRRMGMPGSMENPVYGGNPAGMIAVPSVSAAFVPTPTGTMHPISCGRATSFCRR